MNFFAFVCYYSIVHVLIVNSHVLVVLLHSFVHSQQALLWYYVHDLVVVIVGSWYLDLNLSRINRIFCCDCCCYQEQDFCHH